MAKSKSQPASPESNTYNENGRAVELANRKLVTS
jgi:hypothetical protein